MDSIKKVAMSESGYKKQYHRCTVVGGAANSSRSRPIEPGEGHVAGSRYQKGLRPSNPQEMGAVEVEAFSASDGLKTVVIRGSRT
jgi:hypothetical protein